MFTHPQSINVVFNINQDTHHTETELAQSAIALLYCLYDFITILFPPFNSQCERWTRIMVVLIFKTVWMKMKYFFLNFL